MSSDAICSGPAGRLVEARTFWDPAGERWGVRCNRCCDCALSCSFCSFSSAAASACWRCCSSAWAARKAASWRRNSSERLCSRKAAADSAPTGEAAGGGSIWASFNGISRKGGKTGSLVKDEGGTSLVKLAVVKDVVADVTDKNQRSTMWTSSMQMFFKISSIS